MIVTTRFAPSPTGRLHLGGARIALFNWLYAKKHKGVFILRIDDTDQSRSINEYENNIIDSLTWLDLKYDAFYRQSQRNNIYAKYLDILVQKKLAYLCSCPDICVNNCRNISLNINKKHVVRLRVDKGIIWEDKNIGFIELPTSQINDYVLKRSNGSYTYNFTTVVDDIDMNITDIIRGADHITNTGKQAIIYSYFNAKMPNFYHAPLLLSPNSSAKLSKRHGDIDISFIRSQGIISQGLKNYLFRLSCSNKDQEIFTLHQMIEHFNPIKMNKSPAKIDNVKLQWFNKNHIALNCLQISKHLKVDENIIQKASKKFSNLIDIKKSLMFIDNEPEVNNNNIDINILKTLLLLLENNCINIWEQIIAISNVEPSKISIVIKLSLTGEHSIYTIQQIIQCLGVQNTITRLKKIINNYEQQ